MQPIDRSLAILIGLGSITAPFMLWSGSSYDPDMLGGVLAVTGLLAAITGAWLVVSYVIRNATTHDPTEAAPKGFDVFFLDWWNGIGSHARLFFCCFVIALVVVAADRFQGHDIAPADYGGEVYFEDWSWWGLQRNSREIVYSRSDSKWVFVGTRAPVYRD